MATRARLLPGVVATLAMLATLVVNAGPAAAASPPPHLGELSTDVTADGVLRTPSGVTVAPDGSVYVADSLNHRVQRFAANGTLLTSWGSYGHASGQFRHPHDVAVDASGNVYVVDQENNRVQKFDANGAFLTMWGSTGSANGQFDTPFAIAVDSDGVVYVTDPGNFRVQRFSSGGAFLDAWSQSDAAWGIAVDANANVYVGVLQVGSSPVVQQRSPTGAFVTSWTLQGTFGQNSDRPMVDVDSDGHVYVTHPVEQVVEYTSTGGYVASGFGDGFVPDGIAVTATGHVIVTDEVGRMREFDGPGGLLVRQFGAAGSGEVPGGTRPVAVAFDAAGNRYVADFGLHRILKLNAAGAVVAEWGHLGSGPGEFNLPVGVAVDSAGNVFVADTNNHRIQKFGPTGAFLASWGSEGGGQGQFSVPGGVDVDDAGNVYVADSGNARVQKFTNSGGFLTSWGGSGNGEGQFTFPADVAVDPDGNVYVSDASAGRVQRFTAAGAFLTSWNAPGESIAVNSGGAVFLADREQARVRRYTPAGALVTQWGSFGIDPGQFDPAGGLGVGVDAADHVHVADYGNRRIQEFGAEGVALRPDALIRKGGSGPYRGNNRYNASGTSQSVSGTVRRGGTITYSVLLQNDSSVPDRLRIRVTRPTNPNVSLNVKIGTRNITLAATGLTEPYFTTGVVAPGERVLVKVRVKISAGRRGTQDRGKLTVRSDTDPTVRDVVGYTTRLS